MIKLPIKNILPMLTSLLQTGFAQPANGMTVSIRGPRCLFLKYKDGDAAVTLDAGSGDLVVEVDGVVVTEMQNIRVTQPETVRFFRDGQDALGGWFGAYFDGPQRHLMAVWNESAIDITPTEARLKAKKPGIDYTVTGIRINPDGTGKALLRGAISYLSIECV